MDTETMPREVACNKAKLSERKGCRGACDDGASAMQRHGGGCFAVGARALGKPRIRPRSGDLARRARCFGKHARAWRRCSAVTPRFFVNDVVEGLTRRRRDGRRYARQRKPARQARLPRTSGVGG